MNETKMFCFQCQETAKGTGCTTRGVCGKLPETSLYMDILLSIVKTMGTLMEKRMKTMPTDSCDKDKKCCPCFEEVSHFITDSLFATITNANFDDESLKARIHHGLKLLEFHRHYHPRIAVVALSCIQHTRDAIYLAQRQLDVAILGAA